MRKLRRLTVILAGALALGGLSAFAPAVAPASAAACPAPIVTGDTELCGSLADGAANPAQDVGDPVTGGWLLTHGFALAGSSYASTGWAIAQALPDQVATLGVFGKLVGHPRRTIAWGHSLGGIITAGLIQRYPDRFTAALPMCGVLSGGVATWNTALDAAFAFQQLL